MRDAESAITAGFYDHEQELARDRDDRADDWGADAVFASGTRRRFNRRPVDADAQVRRHAGARSALAAGFERRTSGPAAAVAADPWLDRAAEPVLPATADAAAELPGAVLTTGLEWADDGAQPAELAAPAVRDEIASTGDWLEPASPGGRRTVVVTGRPGMAAMAPPARPISTGRRRPRRRPVEHLGARPDRIAGWAFGLGMLLILVAVGTADAAPL